VDFFHSVGSEGQRISGRWIDFVQVENRLGLIVVNLSANVSILIAFTV